VGELAARQWSPPNHVRPQPQADQHGFAAVRNRPRLRASLFGGNGPLLGHSLDATSLSSSDRLHIAIGQRGLAKPTPLKIRIAMLGVDWTAAR
jgi:hypothetical protein